jgi:hypothetical protein
MEEWALYKIFFKQFSVLTIIGPIAFTLGFFYKIKSRWRNRAQYVSSLHIFLGSIMRGIFSCALMFLGWVVLNLFISLLVQLVDIARKLNEWVPGLFFQLETE